MSSRLGDADGELIAASATGSYPSTDAASEEYSLAEKKLILRATCKGAYAGCPTNWYGQVSSWLTEDDYTKPDQNSLKTRLAQEGYLLILGALTGGESLLAKQAIREFVTAEGGEAFSYTFSK